MALMELLLLLVIISIGILLCYYYNLNYWNLHKIPNVRGLFCGNFINIIRSKTNLSLCLKSLYLDAKFQDIAVVGIYIPLKPALLIRHPDLIKSILNKDFHRFRNRFGRSDPHADPIGHMALTIAPYELWREMRNKLSPLFSVGKLKRIYNVIQKSGENLEKHLFKHINGAVIEMKMLSSLYTIDVTNNTIAGIDSNVLENPKDRSATVIQSETYFNWKRNLHWNFIFLMPYLTGLFKAKFFTKEFEDFALSSTDFLVTERERSGRIRHDLIDVFVKMKQEAEQSGENMTVFRNQISAQFGTLLFAGFESSSFTLSNLFLELAKQPVIQERLRAEILQAFQDGNGAISFETLSELKYLEMVLSETLRMYPLAPLLERQHNSSDDGALYTLKPYVDYTVPAGMVFYISVHGLHYNPEYWPNPESFDPERFTIENIALRHPMVYLPFGSGPRNCIASRLGVLQMKNAIVYLLRNHCVKLCPQTNLKPEWDANALVLKTKGDSNLQIMRVNMYEQNKF